VQHKKFIYGYSFLFFSLLSLTTHAVIPYGARYRLDDKECILLYDAHVDFPGSKVVKLQNEQLLNSKYVAHATILVEDIFEYTNLEIEVAECIDYMRKIMDANDPLPLPLHTQFVEDTGLFHMPSLWRNKGISVKNIEFRQPYVANLVYHAQKNIVLANKMFEFLMQHFDTVIKQIRTYNDTPDLNNYYKEVITKAEKALTFLQKKYLKIGMSESGLARFCLDRSYCMCHLFDAVLIHTWFIESKRNNKIVVFVGGKHAHALEQMLCILGYSKINESGSKKTILDFIKIEPPLIALEGKLLLPLKLTTICKIIYYTCKFGYMHYHYGEILRQFISDASKMNLDELVN
jgi:hypothetical protein